MEDKVMVAVMIGGAFTALFIACRIGERIVKKKKKDDI